jgi:hypothetical protein
MGQWSNETMDIGKMEAGTMRSGTIPGSNPGVVFCQLIITTTIIVIIVSIIIVISTIVCIPPSIIHPHRRPSSLTTQNANAIMKTHLSAVGVRTYAELPPVSLARALGGG